MLTYVGPGPRIIYMLVYDSDKDKRLAFGRQWDPPNRYAVLQGGFERHAAVASLADAGTCRPTFRLGKANAGTRRSASPLGSAGTRTSEGHGFEINPEINPEIDPLTRQLGRPQDCLEYSAVFRGICLESCPCHVDGADKLCYTPENATYRQADKTHYRASGNIDSPV